MASTPGETESGKTESEESYGHVVSPPFRPHLKYSNTELSAVCTIHLCAYNAAMVSGFLSNQLYNYEARRHHQRALIRK